MTYGVLNGHVTDDVTWPHRCCEAVLSAILATAWLLVLLSHRTHYTVYYHDIFCRETQRPPAHEPVMSKPIPAEEQMEIRERW